MTGRLVSLDTIKIALRNRIWHRSRYPESGRSPEEQRARDAECADIIDMIDNWEPTDG